MSVASENLISYCGLKCAECFSYKRTVSEAAKSLRREIRAAHLKNFWSAVPFLGDYATFKKSLDGLARFYCTNGCRDGGGNPFCKIRKCARKNNFDGCWECEEFEQCTKLNPAYLKNIKKIKKLSIEEYVKP